MATLPPLPAGIRARPDRTPRHVELHALIDAALADLRAYVPRATALVDQRGVTGPGFLTPDARKRRDEAVRSERAARHAAALAGVKIPGETPAPLNVAAVSVEPEVRAHLASIVDELHDELHRAGVCWVHETWQANGHHANRGLADLTSDVSGLVRLVRRPSRLEPIHRGLEDLVTRTKRVIDGDDRSSHPDPCPHCGRRTLVAYLHLGVIRCEKDPGTRHLEPCRCTDAYCPCHRGGRHEWHRAERGHKTTSWHGLRRAQAAVRHDKENEMTAQAAVDRVRALHAPVHIRPWAEDCPVAERHHHAPNDNGDELCWDCQALATICDHCLGADEEHADYPCATIRALDTPEPHPDQETHTEGAHP